MNFEKNIFLLWLQGWEKAPWLQQKNLNSWRVNNPNWDVHLIDWNNLSNYIKDIDYIYDDSKDISFQAISDIVRLSLLKNYGGVWADSTLLCMQPLDHWFMDALHPSGMWMYHGHGAEMNSDLGPASWFILSEKKGYLITKWKKACDRFWAKNNNARNYFWMDSLFKNLVENDKKFKKLWVKTPFLYCEKFGSSHTLADYNCGMIKDTKLIKEIFQNKPPYVLKLSSKFKNIFPELNSKKFINSNAYFAISMSQRQYIYNHGFDNSVSIISPIKKNTFLKILIKIIKKIINNIYLMKFYSFITKLIIKIYRYFQKL